MLSRRPISAAPISALPSAAPGGSRSFTVTPTAIYTNGASKTLTLSGVGTDWLSNPATFTVSAGATKNSQNVTSNTAATLVVTAGASPATITVSDGTSSDTFAIGTPSFTASPISVIVSTTGNIITLSGTNTLWQSDAPTFSLSGGTGASITAQNITGNYSATVTISAGAATGTLTITDPASGATQTVTVVGVTLGAVVLLSPFFSTDPAPAGYRLYKWQTGSFVADGARETTGIIAISGVTNGYAVEATPTLDADGGYRGLILWDDGASLYMAEEIYIPPTPSGSGVTPPVGGAGTVTGTLVDSGGTPRAGLSGLRWAFFDQARPDLLSVPAETGSGATTDGSGVITIALTNTTLSAGQTGFLVVSDTDGTTTQSPVAKAFARPVTVS